MGFIEIATPILKKVSKILKKNNISFHLEYGTCLGAVREQNFIDWDYDIDLGTIDVISQEKRDKLLSDLLDNGLEAKWNFDFLEIKWDKYHLDMPFYFLDKGYYRYLRTTDYKPRVWGGIPEKFFKSFKKAKLGKDIYFIPEPPEPYLDWLKGKYPIYENWRIPIIKQPE